MHHQFFKQSYAPVSMSSDSAMAGLYIYIVRSSDNSSLEKISRCSYHGLYIASTSCTRSNIARTKQNIIISKIRKN